MKSEHENTPVIVFEGNDWECAMVKSLLNNAEIESFLNQEYQGVMAPWQVAAGGAGSIKIVVSNLDFERAKEVVEDYLKAEGNLL